MIMMMKRLIYALACALLVVACKGGSGSEEKKPSASIAGEWQLSDVATKASVGSETVMVYLDFNEDNTFSLYQMLGIGRYRLHTGTWSMTGSSLTGKYSTGTAWSGSYEASLEGENTLVLTFVSADASLAEVDTYTRTTIPDSVKSSAE